MTARPPRRLPRSLALLSLFAFLSGCVAESAKEARCACFKSDGSPTGRCDFSPLPAGGPGAQGPAVFKLLDVDLASTKLAHTALHSHPEGRCGG
jgi:hypothetical protein